MQSTSKDTPVPKTIQHRPPTSPDPLSSNKKSLNFISKNIEKLKKKSVEIDLDNINIKEILDSEPTPKSSKPISKSNPKSNPRGQSFTRPVKKSDSKLTEEQKEIERTLNNTSKNIYQRDAQIEGLLKGSEKNGEEGRMSPVRSNTPFRIEDRANKRSGSKAPEGYDVITTSLRSQEVLANKFIKEFQSVLGEVEVESGVIDLKKMILVLKKVRLIKNDTFNAKHDDEVAMVLKLWRVIGGELTAKVQNLLCVCLNILNLYSPNGHLADSECPTLKSWSFINGIFVYNSEEALKLHKTFYEFYQNRQLSPKKVTESQDLTKEYSFKPTINRVSRDLASEGRNRYGSLGSQKREEFLNKKKEEIIKQRDKSLSKKDESEIKICTFQPTLLARSGSKQKKNERMIKSPVFRVEERKVKNFGKNDNKKIGLATSPKLDREKGELNQEFYSVKVQKEISRMKKVREDKEKKRTANIFRHKKSNSVDKKQSEGFCLEEKDKDKGNCTTVKENVTDRPGILRFDEGISYSSPYLNSDTKSIDVSEIIGEENKEFEAEDTVEEGSVADSVNRVQMMQVKNHSITLQLINFINEHNLSEDSAEQLLKIFTTAPKIS